MKNFYSIFFIFAFFYGNSQVLIDFTPAGSYTASQVASNFGFNADFDVDLYKVLYTTKNIGGENHTASGLVCLPKTSGDLPLLCYQHGTVGSREDVPSRKKGGFDLGVVFASTGYATIMADYIGLGDSPGLHPYIHSESEAWAALDLMSAMKELQVELNFSLNEQVFLTGYSQGGHASAALHRMIERDAPDGFTVTAGAHLSGPYSVSEKMIDFTLGDNPYQFVAYLAWVTLGMLETFPDLLKDFELSDIFKPAYIDPILQFKNEEIDLWSLNSQLYLLININNAGNIQPKVMIQDDVLSAIKNDPNHPMSQALKRNDVLDWVPQSPTRLYYCKNDDQVSSENAIYADSIFNANGAVDVASKDLVSNFNHTLCVEPAVEETIDFFSQFSGLGVTSHLNNSPIACDFELIYSNNEIRVSNNLCNLVFTKIEIIDITGRIIVNNRTFNGDSVLIENIHHGIYIIRIKDKNENLFTKKIWIH